MTEQSGSSRVTASGARPADGFKAEMERAKGTAGEVRAELARARDDRRGGPATSVGDATAKAAQLRAAIDRDLAALRARTPEASDAAERARTLGAAVGGAVLVVAGGVALLRRRGERRGREAAVRAQAAAIARELLRLEEAEPDADGQRRGGLGWAALGAVGAAASAFAWKRTRGAMGVDDPFGDPMDDPLRPDDVTAEIASELGR